MGDEAYSMFYLDTLHRQYEIGDHVIIDGYLETSYYLHGNFFYHVEDCLKVNEKHSMNTLVH